MNKKADKYVIEDIHGRVSGKVYESISDAIAEAEELDEMFEGRWHDVARVERSYRAVEISSGVYLVRVEENGQRVATETVGAGSAEEAIKKAEELGL